MEDLEKIKQNPYKLIKEHYESILPCIGAKVMSILCFLPISLILPKIVRDGKEIRMHLNMLLLGISGIGKSSLCREFEKITYFPLSTKNMTPARMYWEITKNQERKIEKKLSLIIEDIAVWFLDEERIKLLEGLIGEEESISRENMRNIKDNEESKKIDACAFMCGTPEVISDNKVQTGILRRTIPLIVFLSEEENERIIEYISENMGKDGELKDSIHIKEFYDELYTIQEGHHSEIPPIEGFIFPDHIRTEIKIFLKNISKPLFKRHGVSLATESEEIFRILSCHAFLNVFNKYKNGMIKDNYIVIDEDDLKVAKSIITREISCKYIILQCIESIDWFNIRTRNQLREWEEKRRISGKNPIPKEAKFILEGMVKK